MTTNQVGPHTTYFEEPDIIYMKGVGYMSPEDGLEMLRLQRDYGTGRDHCFFLIDMTELDGFDPQVRKAAAEVLRDMPLRGMSIFGAPLKARMAAKLIITASNLFRKERDLNPMNFVKTEDEARMWIAERRQAFGFA